MWREIRAYCRTLEFSLCEALASLVYEEKLSLILLASRRLLLAHQPAVSFGVWRLEREDGCYVWMLFLISPKKLSIRIRPFYLRYLLYSKPIFFQRDFISPVSWVLTCWKSWCSTFWPPTYWDSRVARGPTMWPQLSDSIEVRVGLNSCLSLLKQTLLWNVLCNESDSD